MQFIASAQGYTATPETSLDCSTTLNINAGDVLVAFAMGSIGPAHIDSIAEDDASNSFDTVYAVTASWWSVGSGYLLSASASTGATFRVTLSEIPNGGFGFIVLQFRPDAGETVSFGSAPASANSGWGTNPTSAALSTASTDSLFVGCATNDRSALSNIRIEGVAVDGSVAHATLYATAGYTVFDSAQTDINYQTASGDGVWGVQMIGLDITIEEEGTAYTRSISDSVGIADALTRASAKVRAISDSAGISDVLSRVTGFIRTLTESVGIADIVSGIKGVIRSISDAVGITDVISGTRGLIRTISESIGIMDILSRVSTYKRTIVNSVGVTDTLIRAAQYIRRIYNSIGISDTIIGRLIILIWDYLFKSNFRKTSFKSAERETMKSRINQRLWRSKNI